MKKSFSVLGAFCLGLFISVAVIACAVDDDYKGSTNSPNNANFFNINSVSHNKHTLNSNEYDENGRFEKIIFHSSEDGDTCFNISYSGNSIIMSTDGSSTTIECSNKVENVSAQEFNQTIINGLVLLLFS